MATQIIIADDHLLFADGISTLLSQAEGLEVIAIVSNGDELLKTLSKQQADLILLDISMPGMNGLEAAICIKALYPAIKILVVTMSDSVDIIRSLMDAGVNGIILKNTGKTELLLAIAEVCKGDGYFSQKITLQLAKGYQYNKQDKWQLTKREKEVLHLVYEGLSTSGIAEKLFISVYTVETHKKNLFLKSGVNKSALLIKQAQELGYIKTGPLEI